MNVRQWRRTWVTLSAAALATAIAVPSTAATAAPRTAAAATTDFFSSFEADGAQPAWANTVETNAAGDKKAAGVNGGGSGGLPGNIMDKVVEITASGENANAGEGKAQLVDGDIQSKWLTFDKVGWVAVKLTAPEAVVRYTISSANDAPERDPKDWAIEGSQDGQSWTAVDTQNGQDFAKRFQTKDFTVANTTAYLYYRLNVTLNHGASDAVQLADWQLSIGGTTPPPAPEMRSQVGNGPVSSPAAKVSVGFTGTKALQYGGEHSTDGRGYSYNKVFDVDVAVTPTTELSYKIFPEWTDDDLKYRSTYAAVDLAFTDGTYLSDLASTDEQFAVVSPRGQGDSKTLYTSQWNSKITTIGSVAAGKTIDRILVGYDSPAGTGRFKGWLDDIRIVGTPPSKAKSRPSEYVLTTRGTHSTGGFSRGNNIPATAVPHGFNFWTPATNAGTRSWLYDYHRANNSTTNLPAIQSFSVSHEPSPWMGDRQTFQVLPSAATGTPDANRGNRALQFKHENEVAQPHYYSVKFENGIKTEITPTDHAALLRFTYTGDSSNLILDNINNDGGLTIDAATSTISGYSDVRSGLSAGATRMFVYAVLDKPITGSGKLTGGGGDNVTGYVKFDTTTDKVATLRIATSLLSVEQAKKNLSMEIAANDTFDAVKERAQKAWDSKLKVIEVEGANHDQLTTMYSNLYRLFLYPNSAFENTGTAQAPVYKYASPVSPLAGANTPTETGAKIVDGKIYVNNGFWDTYRTTWAAYSLLTPKMAGELVDGFVQQYKDGGWVSRWSSPGYADLMTGTSSDVAFADAYLKGIKNIDVQAMYDAAVKSATVTPPNGAVGRKGNNTSIFKGYTPEETHEGVSWALEGYINDFGIANMSKKLHDEAPDTDPRKAEYKENYHYFLSRAQNYVNMFDPNTEFFQGRKKDGSWRLGPDKYDPRVWGFDYTETDGWNFAFSVPHDGQGLANLYGGKDKLAKKLDTFFETPETTEFVGSYGGVIHEMTEARDVRMGQYGHSNQVSHHILYMYDYVGQPWKTQAKVREALGRLYTGSEIGQGYPGDEDNGEQSAWNLFGSLGFYPLQVGSPFYTIGSPAFKKMTVNLENGKKIVVNAPKNSAKNVYIQGMKFNGVKYGRTFINHADLANGAVIDFDMGPNPSTWGAGDDKAPKSITQGSEVPRPLGDTAKPGTGTATASNGVDVKGLFDDSSDTRVSFDGKAGWVQYKFAEGKPRPTFYTLTSGDKAGDPKSWKLQGSYNGKTWTDLDTRADQQFKWRLQTRAFKIANPGKYQYFRVEFTDNSGEATTTLAEVELLMNQ